MIRMKKKPRLRVVGPVDTEKLEGFVKRIEAVESEEADYKAAKKDLYVEVRAAGLKPKLVRKVVKERKPKAVDEAEEAELEAYRETLGMASLAVRTGQLSLREAERAFGVSKSSIHRHLSVPEVSHDPATGEVIEPTVTSAPSVMPAPSVWHEVTAVWQTVEAERKAAREAERERRRAAHAAWVAKNAEIDADPLTLPPALAEKRREIEERRRATA
jgi:uncharacterized protein (UPF0335 family)